MTDDAGWFSEAEATFGDRLAGARESAGLTQKALAKNLGVKTATLVAWENDLSEPRANRLQMLSGILGVSLGWLLTGEGDGLDQPAGTEPISGDMTDLMIEMRSLRVQMIKSAEKLGQLEKRLRTALREEG
ncbi:MAG: helix-turn-helix domain-containing protein [Cognatishimia sp.]|uniref:helix-turn-helix domain-containing protein n=1 Tax=Cognatishimia sp. 1_MG-2023 TaxID=3062642 RepID=UPI0026E46A02|nr:helix-turn-helix domain-containing protein [Cognatishimia sp. 1_MG-2023]MDO6727360.1 helix-turn-helix domain-containing protein [Cognatishimia sp. 1_MG-2023]